MVLGILLLLATLASAEGRWVHPDFVPSDQAQVDQENSLRGLADTFSVDNRLSTSGETSGIIVLKGSDGSDILVGGETAINQSQVSLVVEGVPYDVSDLKFEQSVSSPGKVLRLLTVDSEDSFLRKLSEGNRVDLETVIRFSNISIVNRNTAKTKQGDPSLLTDATRSKIVLSDGGELDTSDQLGRAIEFKSDATAKYRVNDFELIQPYAVNGKGERINLDFSITLKEGGATVGVHIPMKWVLSSPLPIIIDPSWTRATGIYSSSCPGSNYSGGSCLDAPFTSPGNAIDDSTGTFANCNSYTSCQDQMVFNISNLGRISNISVIIQAPNAQTSTDVVISDNQGTSCSPLLADTSSHTFYCAASNVLANSSYRLTVYAHPTGTCNCHDAERKIYIFDVQVYSSSTNASISIVSPDNATTMTKINDNTIQNFSFSIYKGDYALSSVQLWGNFTGSWAQANSTVVSGNGTVTLSYTPPNTGTFIWRGVVVDSSGSQYTVNRTLYAVANPVPSIGYTAPYMDSGSYLYRSYIYEQIACSDIDLQNQTLRLYDSGGSLLNQQWSSSNIFIYNWSSLSYGTYYANGSCYDTISQVASTPSLSIVLATTTTTTTLKANGISCSVAGDCTSGNCVDGVCCSTTCSGSCQRCSGSSPSWTGTNGTCSNVPIDQDPDTECGMVGCDGGAVTPYFDDWSSLTCYYKLNVSAANAKCDGGGACITASDYCPNQPTGGSTGVVCNCVAAEIGCGYTTAGSCDNVMCSSPGIALNSPSDSVNILPGGNQVFTVTPVQGDNPLANVTVFLWNAFQEICGRNSTSSVSSNVSLSLSLRVSGYGANKWNAQVYDNLALSSWGAFNRTLYATTTTTTTTTLPPTTSTIVPAYETPAFHALMSLDMKAFYTEVWGVRFGTWIYVLALFPIILVMYRRTNSILYTAMVLLIMLGMLAWVVLPAPVNIFAFVLIILGIGSGLYKLIWS